MKDNTVTYLLIGGALLYVLTRPKTVVPVASYPSGSVLPPVVQPPQQSLLLPILSTAAALFQKITSGNTAASNVAAGYNADGTITLPGQTQTSISQLTPPALQNITIPVPDSLYADSGTNNPAGSDLYTSYLTFL